MRKVFIFSVLLMVAGTLVLVSGSRRGPLVSRSGKHDNEKAVFRSQGYDEPSSSSKDPRSSGHFTIEEKNRREYLRRYHELKQEEAKLEALCNECRVVLEKAAIEDSVYDQYDNPQGRLLRYKIDRTVATFLKSSKRLLQNREEQRKLNLRY